MYVLGLTRQKLWVVAISLLLCMYLGVLQLCSKSVRINLQVNPRNVMGLKVCDEIERKRC